MKNILQIIVIFHISISFSQVSYFQDWVQLGNVLNGVTNNSFGKSSLTFASTRMFLVGLIVVRVLPSVTIRLLLMVLKFFRMDSVFGDGAIFMVYLL